MSSAVAHDLYYRVFNPRAPERLRLLVGRLAMVPALAAAAYLGINPPGFVAQVVAFAFGLAASGLFPAILLGIFDRRMNAQGAIAGMLVGLGFTSVMIGLMRAPQLFGAAQPVIKDFFGISAEGIGIVGMALNLVTALDCLAPDAAAPNAHPSDCGQHPHPARGRRGAGRVKAG
jgi:cation/acetate symporter